MLSSISTLILLYISTSRARVQSSNYDGSFTYLVGDNAQPYYSPSPEKSTAVGTYAVAGSGDVAEVWVPFPVLVTNASEITAQTLNDTISSYLEDDVFDKGFLEGSFIDILDRREEKLTGIRPSDHHNCTIGNFNSGRCNIPGVFVSVISVTRLLNRFKLD
jgi:hypothetical protein